MEFESRGEGERERERDRCRRVVSKREMSLVTTSFGDRGSQTTPSASRSIVEAQRAEAAEALGKPGDSYKLIDSLAYADHIPPACTQEAQRLILEEARRMPKSREDYLKELPSASDFNGARCPLAARELERLERGEQAGIDLSRYDLPSGGKDAKSWVRAVQNAESQLEHQSNRVENLELMLKSGASVWREANKQLEGLCASVARETEAAEGEIEAMNRERKLHQMTTGNQIAHMEREWFDQVHKNRQIEFACSQLERKKD